jgi:putative ABC transport system ATP-binding protein
MFQQWNLLGHLTVAENIAVVHALAEEPTSWRHPGTRRADRELMDRLNIAHRAHSYPTTLSGGEAARAALAVAVAAGPLALIADEPTGELDSLTETTVLDLIADQARQGLAVIIASHSPAVAARADRVLPLRDGALADRPAA